MVLYIRAQVGGTDFVHCQHDCRGRLQSRGLTAGTEGKSLDKEHNGCPGPVSKLGAGGGGWMGVGGSGNLGCGWPGSGLSAEQEEKSSKPLMNHHR